MDNVHRLIFVNGFALRQLMRNGQGDYYILKDGDGGVLDYLFKPKSDTTKVDAKIFDYHEKVPHHCAISFLEKYYREPANLPKATMTEEQFSLEVLLGCKWKMDKDEAGLIPDGESHIVKWKDVIYPTNNIHLAMILFDNMHFPKVWIRSRNSVMKGRFLYAAQASELGGEFNALTKELAISMAWFQDKFGIHVKTTGANSDPRDWK